MRTNEFFEKSDDINSTGGVELCQKIEILNDKDFAEYIGSLDSKARINKNIVIGSSIKQARQRLNLTLEEVCKDICCLAYLSKLERNQIAIVQNPYVRKICERLDINYNDICDIREEETIKEIYGLYLNNKRDEIIQKVALLNKSVFYATDELSKAFVSLLVGNLKEFNKIMLEIDKVKNSLTYDEVIFMLFIMIEYFYLTNQYTKCHNYLMLTDRFNISDENLKILLQERRFYTESNLSNSSYKYEYIKLKSFFDYQYPLDRQIKARFQLLINENSEESLKNLDLINFGNINLKEDYAYAKALLLINNDFVKEGLELLLKENNKTAKFIALYCYGVLLFKKSEKNRKLVSTYVKKIDSMIETMERSISDTIHTAFIELMKLELGNNTEAFICDYIKLKFLDIYKTYQYYPYQKYIDCRYYYLMGLLSRYKDAYNYSLQRENVMQNTKFYNIINEIKK